MKLTGQTTPYAVLGHPIGHSLSPAMHNASLRKLGLDAIYLAFDVHPDRLLDVLPAMRDMGFGGVNLTVPLKEVAFNGIPDLARSAQSLGAVNTVEFLDDGTMRGHNTDGNGFVLALRDAFDSGVSGQRVFVLGSGGAGRAVAITCGMEQAAEVVLTDMDPGRAEQVADEIRALGTDAAVSTIAATPEAWADASRAADLVVQATPVGMHEGDASLLGADAFRSGQKVFDLIYMYPETPFMAAARTGGADVANGLGMLLEQGASAFTIWTGQAADTDAMRAALESEVYSSG